MKNNCKRLFAILMALALVIGLLPTFAAAAPLSEKEVKEEAHVYTEEENALIENDVFASIDAVKAEAAQKLGGVAKMTEQDYINIESEVIEKILASDTYVPGTLQQNGNFLVWMTTVGIPCCYDPRMEAELHNTADEPSAEEIARIEADAEALLETYATRGGSPTSTKIGLIQPYWESSSALPPRSPRAATSSSTRRPPGPWTARRPAPAACGPPSTPPRTTWTSPSATGGSPTPRPSGPPISATIPGPASSTAPRVTPSAAIRTAITSTSGAQAALPPPRPSALTPPATP